ncbi:hypothetical protein PVL29_009486 [Vitis rotundifolia]|uniref:Prolamin-like domain-containing protein n=1 Tax=Vitis rotundifolia TaxID=103349 RepID=A0AA38ZQS2_VITRO|nr:hypothetical protein PVL29_009486 [Vitis rotundifolia]
MARLTYVIPTMVAFFLCSAMAVDLRNLNDRTVPWYAQVIPPEPFRGFYGKIIQCMWKLDPICGKQVYARIFNPSISVDDYCCRNIATVGVTCNRYLGWALSLFEKFKRYAGLIDRRSKIIFIDCIKRKL